jgi:MSHA pilin protein MshD
MSINRQAGMTLIELVMAIVIVSVGLAGVMLAFSTVVKSSSDPLVRKQMLAIAEEMMEEITLKPFAVAANAAPAPACARNTYNDIRDYNGYSAGAVCDIDGTAIPSLSAYGISSVTVAADTLGALGGGQVMRITVTVSHGADTLQLLGWRTNYAQ